MLEAGIPLGCGTADILAALSGGTAALVIAPIECELAGGSTAHALAIHANKSV